MLILCPCASHTAFRPFPWHAGSSLPLMVFAWTFAKSHGFVSQTIQVPMQQLRSLSVLLNRSLLLSECHSSYEMVMCAHLLSHVKYLVQSGHIIYFLSSPWPGATSSPHVGPFPQPWTWAGRLSIGVLVRILLEAEPIGYVFIRERLWGLESLKSTGEADRLEISARVDVAVRRQSEAVLFSSWNLSLFNWLDEAHQSNGGWSVLLKVNYFKC